MDNVIQSGVSGVASLNPSAVEAVGGQAVHISSTEAALVGRVKGGAKVEANSQPDEVIVHP